MPKVNREHLFEFVWLPNVKKQKQFAGKLSHLTRSHTSGSMRNAR